jgi:hypothetical protein
VLFVSSKGIDILKILSILDIAAIFPLYLMALSQAVDKK